MLTDKKIEFELKKTEENPVGVFAIELKIDKLGMDEILRLQRILEAYFFTEIYIAKLQNIDLTNEKRFHYMKDISDTIKSKVIEVSPAMKEVLTDL